MKNCTMQFNRKYAPIKTHPTHEEIVGYHKSGEWERVEKERQFLRELFEKGMF